MQETAIIVPAENVRNTGRNDVMMLAQQNPIIANMGSTIPDTTENKKLVDLLKPAL